MSAKAGLCLISSQIKGIFYDLRTKKTILYDGSSRKKYTNLNPACLKKDFMTAYGVVRLLDHLISSSMVPYDTEIVNLVECLRGLLSDCVEKHILSITMEN